MEPKHSRKEVGSTLSDMMASCLALGIEQVPSQRLRAAERRSCTKALKLGSRAANITNHSAENKEAESRGLERESRVLAHC